MTETKKIKKEKILVIAGDGAFGEKLTDLLKKDGYQEVFLMKNGSEGLKQIYDLLPHLVIMDVTLPGMSGYEILAKKLAEPLLAKIPVFLLSTQGLPIDIRSVPAGAVTEYIMALHADPVEIVTKVNRHFSYESVTSGSLESDAAVERTGKKKLLWVEDDKLIGNILSKKLTASGFELFHAQNGEGALEILKTVMPNVIVVDLILPGMSGFEILQKINADMSFQKIPKMVLSNLSKPSDIEKAHALGATKFLVKAATSLDQIVAEVKAMC
ncbi:MAG: response regulator [Candidatus Paceibacterota bacterium]